MTDIWYTSAGTRLFSVENGEGTPLVFLHGGMANHLAALPTVLPLTNALRVVTPDVRGNGKSVFGGPLSFDQLADDVVALLDHLRIDRAIVGGVSGGTGGAVRCALKHPGRVSALVVMHPCYAGSARGLTPAQRTNFDGLNGIASRALSEGVQVLKPMYAQLPEPIRTKALQMVDTMDAASVVTTAAFLASGAQPFSTEDELRALPMRTLLIKANDPMHPGEVSELYASALPNCTVVEPGNNATEAIRKFCAP